MGLEAKAGAMGVRLAAFADRGAVEEIAAVELDAGFLRPHFQGPARSGLRDDGRERELAGLIVEHPVVIVAAGELQLFLWRVDALADTVRVREVERRAGDAGEFAGGDKAGIHRGEPAGVELQDVVEDTGADADLIRELVDFGVIKGESRAGTRFFDETEREIIRAVSELARYGVGGRNLRVFRTSADREAQLLQSILAPALRSRNPERRKEAIEALENLASVTTHLKHLLLIRDLRRIAT